LTTDGMSRERTILLGEVKVKVIDASFKVSRRKRKRRRLGGNRKCSKRQIEEVRRVGRGEKTHSLQSKRVLKYHKPRRGECPRYRKEGAVQLGLATKGVSQLRVRKRESLTGACGKGACRRRQKRGRALGNQKKPPTPRPQKGTGPLHG